MSYYSRRRNRRVFRKYPLVIICYVLGILAFVAGAFGIMAALGGADCLPFGIIMMALSIALFVLGKKQMAKKLAEQQAKQKAKQE